MLLKLGQCVAGIVVGIVALGSVIGIGQALVGSNSQQNANYWYQTTGQ
jgi:hypothetical protein